MAAVTGTIPTDEPGGGKTILQHAGSATIRIFQSPACAFSGGNVILALMQAGKPAIAVNACAAAISVVDALLGKKSTIPFIAMAAICGGSALSVLEKSAHEIGLAQTFSLTSPQSHDPLSTALALTLWGTSWAWMAWNKRQRNDNPTGIANSQIYAGLADTAIVYKDPLSMAIFVVGTIKACSRKAAAAADKSVGFIEKHITPWRIYGAGYALATGEAITKHRFEFAAAMALFGLGYSRFSRHLDSDLLPDLAKTIQGKKLAPAP